MSPRRLETFQECRDGGLPAGADTVGCSAAKRPWLDNPRNITVKSNFGGSASSAVSAK